jgi:hypothetical protein
MYIQNMAGYATKPSFILFPRHVRLNKTTGIQSLNACASTIAKW